MAHPLRSRLGKLTPGLSAKERAVLLRAHNAGEPEDPSIRDTMPRSQVKTFNRYAQLIVIANHALWPAQWVLASHV
ncbi:MAG: hypothetical protein HY689_13875 [Chloroflexi bacterium]|nr:hypothetical protein [Chloroflexota bacterium]